MGDEAVQGVVGVRLWRGGGWEDGCVVFCWVMEIGGGVAALRAIGAVRSRYWAARWMGGMMVLGGG